MGCSRRLMLIIGIGLIVLFFVGFALGAIIGKGTNFLGVPVPHTELPAATLVHLFSVGGFDFRITNTVLATWISMAILVVLAFLVTRNLKPVPGKLQSLLEDAVERLLNFVEGVAGKENGRRFFALVATIFLFVLINAWTSLIPGYGSITIGPEGVEPLLRGANTDINFPLALALISFVCVEYWGMKTLRPGHYLSRFLRFGGLRHGLGNLLRGRLKQGIVGLVMGAIDVYTGLLEGLSEIVRILSFTLRLFGNMTAGEVLLLMSAYLFTIGAANVVFYGLEVFLGFVQALIFAGLTLIFATMAVTPHAEAE